MPDDFQHDSQDLVEALLERVRQARVGAERTAVMSAHAVSFARDLFDHRNEYLHSLTTLERVEAEGLHDLFMAEVERSLMRDPHRLTRRGLRTGLLAEWLEVLVEALGEVDATFKRADAFRAAAVDRTDEDREYRAAMRRKTAERWQKVP